MAFHIDEIKGTPLADVDAALEQAWTNLYAKLDMLSPASPQAQSEAQALAIIKTLGQELKDASDALHHIAESLKLRPNMSTTERLRLANTAIMASRVARLAAESVLG
jgi:hypothetical protein